jgi:hypothetical protein
MFSYSAHDYSFIRWLHTPREDGKPRVLVIHIDFNSLIQPFIEHLKKVFKIILKITLKVAHKSKNGQLFSCFWP